MSKGENKKGKKLIKQLPLQKDEEDDFREKVSAAYSAMGKLGGIARAKQIAEKGFSRESNISNKDKSSTTQERRNAMNKDVIKGQWHVIKGKLKEQWGKLTDDEILQMDGTTEELEATLQKAYGYEKDEAQKEIKKFVEKNKWQDK